MALTSVAAVRAAPALHAEWVTAAGAAAGAVTYATNNTITSAPDAAGISPTSLNGVDALPVDGLITRILSDLPGVPAWHALFDLLWVSPDLTATTAGTTILPVTPGPPPARDVDRTSNGRGVVLAYTSTASSGQTVTYTNSAGVSGRAAPVGSSNSNGSFALLPLQAGDEGVRSVQSLTVTSAGTWRLLLLRPIGRYLAGPLDPGQKLPMPQSPLIAGTMLVNTQQPYSGANPTSYVRTEIALG